MRRLCIQANTHTYICVYIWNIALTYVTLIMFCTFELNNMYITAYAENFERLILCGRQVCKDFYGLCFTDHQDEYIVSISHCFFLRITVFALKKKLQPNLSILHFWQTELVFRFINNTTHTGMCMCMSSCFIR